MLGLIMAIIDSSIVNVALTDMAGTLGASIDEISWVATGYILAHGRAHAAQRLADRALRPPQLLCGLRSRRSRSRRSSAARRTSVGQLIIYRVLQGLGGGALQPTAQSILFESYPPERRGTAMAIFGLGAMVGPAIGPTLGGWIVDNSVGR